MLLNKSSCSCSHLNLRQQSGWPSESHSAIAKLKPYQVLLYKCDRLRTAGFDSVILRFFIKHCSVVIKYIVTFIKCHSSFTLTQVGLSADSLPTNLSWGSSKVIVLVFADFAGLFPVSPWNPCNLKKREHDNITEPKFWPRMTQLAWQSLQK